MTSDRLVGALLDGRYRVENPIATGGDGNEISELFICRNLFFNCDHALLLKDLVDRMDTRPSDPAALWLVPGALLLAYGALMIVMMLMRPEGLWPSAVRKRELHVHMDEEIPDMDEPPVSQEA